MSICVVRACLALCIASLPTDLPPNLFSIHKHLTIALICIYIYIYRYEFDMASFDHREAFKLLLRLAVLEPGMHIADLRYNKSMHASEKCKLDNKGKFSLPGQVSAILCDLK